ncbi:hypothetical protein T08_2720 [Trichinella sp. T8]|nr:hypothetical protein T08_2720 [Trichinella sp. T8]
MTGCGIWPACCQHPALDPSRYVAALSLNDLGIPYVQFFGAFIVQCPRPHLRQQRQQKMKKPDLSKSPSHSLLSRKQSITTTEEMDLVELDDAYKCNWGIWFSIFRLLRTEDIMRLAYTSSEMNAMAQSYFNFDRPMVAVRELFLRLINLFMNKNKLSTICDEFHKKVYAAHAEGSKTSQPGDELKRKSPESES